jgi:hypothetical protein
MKRPALITIFLLAFTGLILQSTLLAQEKKIEGSAVHILQPAYSMQLPFGDMKDRYGLSHTIGAGYTFMGKNRMMFTVEGNFLFGPNVLNKSSVFAGTGSWITTTDGYIINKEGVYSNLAVTERGYTVWMKAGKLFPLKKTNPNKGIMVQIGAGMLQHKIRIDVSQNDTPQLRDDYKKGYDRLCNGPALTQFIGYMHLDNNKKINFFGGLELTEAFTQSRRAYYFAERIKPDEKRFDMLIGLKLGWMVPIYSKSGQEYYYY